MRLSIAIFFISLGWSCGSGSAPAAGPRGPQVSLVTTSSAVISWETGASGVGAVELRRAGALERMVRGLEASTRHEIEIVGLMDGAEYEYAVMLDNTVVSAGHVLRILDSEASSLRVVVMGDCGAGTPEQQDVADRIAEWGPDLVLITGDVVYESGADHEVDARYFEPYSDLIDHIPFYTALGNHDVRTDDGQPLLDALVLPRNDRDGSERFYSFDAANVHIVALDSNGDLSAGSSQHEWLLADLAASTAKWTVVFFHHPPYSSSRHGSDLELRAELGPVFDTYSVDLVLSGHDHVYERTFPLREELAVNAGDDPDYSDPGGTIYVVTGGGGKRLYAAGSSEFTASTIAAHHLVALEFEAERWSLTAISSQGETLDRIIVQATSP